MNVARLLAVRAKILAEPENFDMTTWKCGTAGCIGGHAVMLFWNRNVDWRDIDDAASIILDLNILEASKLFHQLNWPAKFRDRMHNANAELAAERIDHFIKTNGE